MIQNLYLHVFYSDQMGNKGAFITLTRDLKPNYTTYDAVVSTCQQL